MLRVGWSSVLIGLVCLVFATAGVQAGPLAKDLDVADSGTTLTSAQREAARALGEASRFVADGNTVEARKALDRASGVPALAGYAELVRVQLLLKEGLHSLAYQTASQAIAGPASDALRAALGVLQGEALAMGGDSSGAELAWNAVLTQTGAEDEAVQNSIQLSIVASRQRTGSLDPTLDPRVLLDQNYAEVAVASTATPKATLPASEMLLQAGAAFEAGRTERAIELFDEAIAGQLDAELVRVAKMGRARALFRARRYESASKAYAALLPDVEARFWLARSLARLDDVEGSLTEFERVSQASNEEFASWALYLMGTLYEGRDETTKAIDAFQRASRYDRYPERVRIALWREGWAQYRSGAYADARRAFAQLVGRLDDPLAQLRPRYWSARAAVLSEREELGRVELERIVREYPLTYYGWRARERLSMISLVPSCALPPCVPAASSIERASASCSPALGTITVRTDSS
jgi:tetratricopeptide (TPR) repeat protein